MPLTAVGKVDKKVLRAAVGILGVGQEEND